MWTNIPWKKHRKSLVAGGLLLALAILAAVAIYTYTAYQKAASDLVVERDRQLAYLSAARFRDELANYSDGLAVVARTASIQGDNVASLQAVINGTASRLAVFDAGIVILDRAGKVIMTYPERPDIAGADWSDRSFFRLLLSSSNMYVADASDDGPGGVQVVAISVPIVGSAGELDGCVAGLFGIGSASTSAFYASLTRLGLEQTGTTYVVDGSNFILYDSSYREAGTAARMMGLPRGFLNTVGAQRTHDSDGNDIVAAHAGIPGTRWTLVTQDDWLTLSAPARRNATTLLMLLGFVIVLPPVGVGLLLREQQRESREHEHSEQEARVASMIQTMLLPRQLPTIPGWDMAIYHEPARSGGRDFYDFLFRPDGSLMLAVGEVSERGLLAVHVISTLRATLRGAAHRQLPPYEALECSNELLCPELAPGMSLRCLYAIINARDGRVQYASAGFNAPYSCDGSQTRVQPATGAPLGEALGTHYEQHDAPHQPGELFVLFTSGLVETSNGRGQSFGLARLNAVLQREHLSAQQAVDALVSEVELFRGKGRAAEDDFVIVVLQRLGDG